MVAKNQNRAEEACGDSCDKLCREHTGTNQRVSSLEEKMKVVADNSLIVNKLAGRVGVLIALMSMGTVAVVGGAVYTFTALSQFKMEYAEHRVAMERHLADTQAETLATLSSKIEGLERRLDVRLDNMSTKIIKLEGAVERSQ